MPQLESFHHEVAEAWDRVVGLPLEVRETIYLDALALLYSDFEQEKFSASLWELLLPKAAPRTDDFR